MLRLFHKLFIMELYIFKTNIMSQEKAISLNSIFNQDENIRRWTIDTEDVDNVLKIEVENSISEIELIEGIKQKGYECEVLP